MGRAWTVAGCRAGGYSRSQSRRFLDKSLLLLLLLLLPAQTSWEFPLSVTEGGGGGDSLGDWVVALTKMGALVGADRLLVVDAVADDLIVVSRKTPYKASSLDSCRDIRRRGFRCDVLLSKVS